MKYNHLGVMIDVSRNSVMTVDALKRFIPLLKKMGYNTLMLYTEDTFEIEGEPYFGYMRGAYTKAELKEIDTFAAAQGIELIPCMQTLAHLPAALRWKKIPVDYDDIMLVDEDRTYELIDRMFATLSDAIQSRTIHIGMDEALMLGRGKFLDKHGYESAFTILRRHLAKVKALAEKYGYTCLMWSDMFFRPLGLDDYYIPKMELPKECKDTLIDGVVPVYWDYYHKKDEEYEDMLYNHVQLSKDVWFAGGAWGWTGIVPHNGYTLETMIPAMRACEKYKVKNIFFTMWGDYGGECSPFTRLPSLFYLAQYAKGERNEEKIKEKFKSKFGIPFDDMMALDLPNALPNAEEVASPSRYMLFADPFNGFPDYTVTPEHACYYTEYKERLSTLAKKYRKYAYLFKTEADICDVLELKLALGIKTREAYQGGDRDALKMLATKDYTEVIRRLRALHKTFRTQWYTDYKTCGFDVQERRFGGTILRMESCRERLLDYCAGKVDRIEELEVKILPVGNAEKGVSSNRMFNYDDYVSANIM